MAQPYDYTLKVPAPGEAFLKAVQVGQQQQQVEAQRAQIKMKQDEAAAALQFQSDVSALMQNPTPDGWKKLIAKYPSEFQTLVGVQKAAESIDRPVMISIARDALMAHRNKKPEMVIKLLDERIAAAKDNPTLQKKFIDMKTGYETYANNPKIQETLIGSVLSQDEEGRGIYNTAFNQTEPYVAVSGVGIVLRSDIDRAVAEAEKTGSPNVNVKPIIPADAEADLKAGRVTPQTFDKVFGVGSAAKVMGTMSAQSSTAGNQPVPASQTITEGEAAKIRKSIGGAAFVEWLRKNNVQIVGK